MYQYQAELPRLRIGGALRFELAEVRKWALRQRRRERVHTAAEVVRLWSRGDAPVPSAAGARRELLEAKQNEGDSSRRPSATYGTTSRLPSGRPSIGNAGTEPGDRWLKYMLVVRRGSRAAAGAWDPQARGTLMRPTPP